MEFVTVWIEGTNGIIMHRFSEKSEGDLGKDTRRTHVVKDTPREQAELAAYREPKTDLLYFPGAAIMRLLREAGSAHKQKGSRKSMKYIIPASVIVMDDAMPIFDKNRKTRLKDFEVDSRPVVIPSTKGRIMRHRPRLDEWTIKFRLRINDALLDSKFVHQLLVEAGDQIGIGDFRPEKGGPFGTFQVVEWTPDTVKKNGADSNTG
jgi:hypothetical protein